MYNVRAVYTPPAQGEMRFEHEYYFNVHVPMMNGDFPGKSPFSGVDIEGGIETLYRTSVSEGRALSAKPSSPEIIAPLIANIYFKNRQDTYAFADFVTGDETVALHADVPKYTNCDIHWTVGELQQPD